MVTDYLDKIYEVNYKENRQKFLLKVWKSEIFKDVEYKSSILIINQFLLFRKKRLMKWKVLYLIKMINDIFWLLKELWLKNKKLEEVVLNLEKNVVLWLWVISNHIVIKEMKNYFEFYRKWLKKEKQSLLRDEIKYIKILDNEKWKEEIPVNIKTIQFDSKVSYYNAVRNDNNLLKEINLNKIVENGIKKFQTIYWKYKFLLLLDYLIIKMILNWIEKIK